MARLVRKELTGSLFDGWSISKVLTKETGGEFGTYQLKQDGDTGKYTLLHVTTMLQQSGSRLQCSGEEMEQCNRELKARAKQSEDRLEQWKKNADHPNLVKCLNRQYITWDEETQFGCDLLIQTVLLQDLRLRTVTRPFTEPEICKLGADLCSGLSHLHSRGMVHGDIREGNIFISRTGNYELGLFSAAALWPEEGTGVREDLSGLGHVLQRLAHRNNPSRAFAGILEKACSADPGVCYRNAEEFGAALNGLLEHHTEQTSGKQPEAVPEKERTAVMETPRLQMKLAQPEARIPQEPDPVPENPEPRKKPEPPKEPKKKPEPPKEPKKPKAPREPKKPRPPKEPREPREKKSLGGMRRQARIQVLVIILLSFLVIGGLDSVLFLVSGSRDRSQTTVQKEPEIQIRPEENFETPEPQEDRETEPRMPEQTEKPEEVFPEQPEETQAPEPEAPMTEAPETEAPETEEPETEAPETEAPRAPRSEIISVAAGGWNSYALRADGTVEAAGRNQYNQMAVDGWTDITAISGGDCHVLGLCSDGTVVAAGRNDRGQCNVSGWSDVQSISAGTFHSVGLRSDGTVVSCGDDSKGQCTNTRQWKDMKQVCAGENHTIGLRNDGRVVACGDNSYGQCEVYGWRDIVAIATGVKHTVGLKADGTVVCCGANNRGQCNARSWTGITQICCGDSLTVGLHENGKVSAVGYNENGQCDVWGWNDVTFVSTRFGHTMGLQSDGTVLTVGRNDNGERNLDSWN